MQDHIHLIFHNTNESKVIFIEVVGFGIILRKMRKIFIQLYNMLAMPYSEIIEQYR